MYHNVLRGEKKLNRIFFLAALASLASGALAQGQYSKVITYERAAREPHVVVYTAISGGNGYSVNPTADNFFTVVGSMAQGNLPWGLTWQALCDNHWTYSGDHFSGNKTPSQMVTIWHDYYTIDGNFSEQDPTFPNDPTKRLYDTCNGDKDIKNGPEAPPPYNNALWNRTCTSKATKRFYMTVSG